MESLETIHRKCHEIFIKGLYDKPEVLEDVLDNYIGQSRACKIYDKLTEGEDIEDCIGENFNQLILRIHNNWFKNYKPTEDIDFYFINYFLLLYLFVERVDLIFNVINPGGNSKLFKDFRHHNFSTLRKIGIWANFIKHPKEFLFTHWAKYYHEGDKENILEPGDVKIDTDFIFNHYNSEKNKRPEILQNNHKVYVEIPNLENLTREFCKEMNVFFDFICSNQIVADFLKKKSTIKNYFDNEASPI